VVVEGEELEQLAIAKVNRIDNEAEAVLPRKKPATSFRVIAKSPLHETRGGSRLTTIIQGGSKGHKRLVMVQFEFSNRLHDKFTGCRTVK
jgi:hypothetical protein